MIAHIKGEVTDIMPDSCVIDVQGIGYQIFIAHPYELVVGQSLFVYTYHHIREDINALFGFLTMDEKNLYIKLLSVKGVGPKVAMTIIAATEINTLLHAIETDDLTYLKKIPGIGPKAAGQIIFDLKGKLVVNQEPLITAQNKEAIEALKALGYTKKEMDYAFKDLDTDGLSVEEIIKKTLQKLMG